MNASHTETELKSDETVKIEDAELLARIVQGKEMAFAEFYDQFVHGLYSLVFKMLNNARETEDVLQEGFTQIWKTASTYDGNRSSAFTWAVMIMRNKAIDHIRSRQRQSRATAAVKFGSSIAPGVQEAKGVFQNEKRTMVEVALEKIPDEQRQAIELAFFSGLTQMQIAEKLGEPLGRVKASIRRGLLKLHDNLAARSNFQI